MSKLLLLPFLVVIGCTSQTTPDSESTENPIGTPPSATTKLSEARVEDLATLDTTNIAPDSSLYIGEVSIFRETGEIYTSVSYHENVNTGGVFDYLQKEADSVVYEEAEIQRARLPISIARKYFNLSGLDTISVYDEADFVGDAVFVRVEYMEDVIEGQFIAVFIPVKKIFSLMSWIIVYSNASISTRQLT